MDRRLFLTGLLGLAGAAALSKIAGPTEAEAAVVKPSGILDELDASSPEEVTEVDHRPGHGRRDRRDDRRPGRRHGRRRRVTRRVCRRVRRHGRWEQRCRREKVWVNR